MLKSRQCSKNYIPGSKNDLLITSDIHPLRVAGQDIYSANHQTRRDKHSGQYSAHHQYTGRSIDSL